MMEVTFFQLGFRTVLMIINGCVNSAKEIHFYYASFKSDCDKKCIDLLRRFKKNPPKNSMIAIHTGLCKARYRCHKGFKLVGKEIRNCKGGKWIEKNEAKCFSLGKVPGILKFIQFLVVL